MEGIAFKAVMLLVCWDDDAHWLCRWHSDDAHWSLLIAQCLDDAQLILSYDIARESATESQQHCSLDVQMLLRCSDAQMMLPVIEREWDAASSQSHRCSTGHLWVLRWLRLAAARAPLFSTVVQCASVSSSVRFHLVQVSTAFVNHSVCNQLLCFCKLPSTMWKQSVNSFYQIPSKSHSVVQTFRRLVILPLQEFCNALHVWDLRHLIG